MGRVWTHALDFGMLWGNSDGMWGEGGIGIQLVFTFTAAHRLPSSHWPLLLLLQSNCSLLVFSLSAPTKLGF